MREIVADRSWDLIYDQVCFDYDEAKASCELFTGKVRGKYIVVSTLSVYGNGSALTEDIFNPKEYTFDKKETASSDYGEAKRQMEVGFYQHATFSFICLRLPVVIGADDYTKRLLFHLEHVQEQRAIYFPNLDARKSFITSDDAAHVLDFLGQSDFEGSINAACPDAVILRDFIGVIEEFTKKKAVLADDGDFSPYGISEDWYLDCSRLNNLGLKLSNVETSLRETLANLLK
jgi:nucleoside-diphosphate-sugar epimerase